MSKHDYELGEDKLYSDDIEDEMDWRHIIDETDSKSEDDEIEEESDYAMDSDQVVFMM